MEDKLVDKVIKDKLCSQDVLPDIINNKVEEALYNINSGAMDNNYNDKEKHVKKQRMAKVAAAAILILGVITAGTNGQAIAAYAKETINSVFSAMKNDRRVNENFSKYSNKVMVQAEDKGITIKVTDIVTDGVTLKLGYIIEDKNSKERDSVHSEGINKDEKYIDNQLFDWEGGWSNHIEVDKNSLMVIDSRKALKNIPNKFNFKWKITNISGVEGNWEVKFDVDSFALSKDSKIIKVDKDYKIGDLKYHVEDITCTPTGNYINLSASAPLGYDFGGEGDEEIKTVIVTDENGVIIEHISSIFSKVENDKVSVKYDIQSTIKKLPKEFNIVPVNMKHFDTKYEIGKKIDIKNKEKINIKVQ